MRKALESPRASSARFETSKHSFVSGAARVFAVAGIARAHRSRLQMASAVMSMPLTTPFHRAAPLYT